MNQIDEVKKYINMLPENDSLSRFLRAYYIHKKGGPTSEEEQKLYKEVIDKIWNTCETDIDTFFKLYNAFLRLCNHLYEYAWEIIKDDEKLKQEFLDTVALECEDYLNDFVNYIYKIAPNDPLINFFMGVKALEEDIPQKPIKHFRIELKSKVIDREVLYINILFLLLRIGNRELAEHVAKNLEKMLEQNKAKDEMIIFLALAHYYLFVGNYEKSKFYAKKLKKFDTEVSRNMMKLIRKRRFSLDNYLYYCVTRANLGEKTCPLCVF